jgi:hypothetical protein
LEIDIDAVALVGSDEIARVVERESLLVARFDAFDQFVVGDGESNSFAGDQQGIHRYPTARLKRQAKSVWGVASVFGKELADRHHAAHSDLRVRYDPKMGQARK